MESIEFRCPVDLRRQAAEQAARHGVSLSEYCRQSLALALAWTAACDTVSAAGTTQHLTSIEQVAQHLANISRDSGP